MRPALPIAVFIAAATAGTALAGPVEIRISNVGPTGPVLVQICTEAELTGGCHRHLKAAPHAGETVVSIADVPPGRYQVSAFQDVDNNGRLNFGMMGAPTEPWGYSRDAKAVMGPPVFADAAVEITNAPTVIPIHLGK